MIKKWFMMLFCRHDWRYEEFGNGAVILKTCRKCGKGPIE